jgi:hypothetical protein
MSFYPNASSILIIWQSRSHNSQMLKGLQPQWIVHFKKVMKMDKHLPLNNFTESKKIKNSNRK